MRIALFAAFPQELRHVSRSLRIKEKTSGMSFHVSRGECFSSEVVLVESGMGMHNTETAFAYVVGKYQPDLILSAGFGGALYEGASIGDLVWASRFFLVPGSAEGSTLPPPHDWRQLPAGQEAREINLRLSTHVPLREGSVITLSTWVEKPQLIECVPADIPFPVSDMETYFFAKLAAEKGFPFFAVRSITDTADEEIPRELLRVTDEAGNYKLPRALATVLTNPGIIPDIVRMGKNSHIASRSLCRLVESLAAIL
jgi:adenosylhomocysteine nucleosidase